VEVPRSRVLAEGVGREEEASQRISIKLVASRFSQSLPLVTRLADWVRCSAFARPEALGPSTLGNAA
jgi:hypothetical protein